MLKLILNPEPSWLELGGGVRVKVPPLTTATLRAVEFAAWRGFAAVKAKANGGDEAVALDDYATARLEGAFALARTRALADEIIAWEGVADDAGNPLIINAQSLDAFAAHPIAGPAFTRAYDATVAPLVAEGNGSANTSTGDGAAVTDTAPDASARPASDAADAPPSSTPRKAGKG